MGRVASFINLIAQKTLRRASIGGNVYLPDTYFDYLKKILPIICLVATIQASAQKGNTRIGVDLGIRNYNLIEDLANNNLYKGTSFSLAAPSVYWLKEAAFSSLSMGFYGANLESEIENSDFTADLNEIEIVYQYLFRFCQLGEISFYVGPGTRPYYKLYRQQFRGSNETTIVESSLVNLHISAAASMQLKSWQVFFLSNMGVYQYWTKAISFATSFDEYPFQTDWIGDFQQLHFSLFGIYKLSDRWEFQPKYYLGYYKYQFQNELTTEVLSQNWTIGFYYLL